MKQFKSVLAMILALVMLLSCIGTALAVTGKTDAKAAAADGKTAASFRELKGYKSEKFISSNAYKYADDEIVRVIVILSGKPEADIAERGTERALNQRTKLMKQHEGVRKSMSGIDYKLTYDFTSLTNGFACDVAYGDLDKIAAIEGVDAVYIANHYALPTYEKAKDTRMAVSNAYFTGIDNAYQYYGVDGTGTVIAVLDTGLNTTHEAFADADKNAENTGVLKQEDISAAVAPGVYINAKVPFAYDYADLDDDVTDCDGHGTHVSGIATGCTYSEEEGAYTFLGAASGAQLVAMKVFSDEGEGTSDDIYFAALEDAYRLGVDVVNMSLGSQNGFTYDNALETVVFGNIYKRMEKAGIIMSLAGGNEYSMAENSAMGYIGPEYQDYGTIGSPASYEGNISVASVENYMYPSYVIKTDAGSFGYVDSSAEMLWKEAFSGKTVDFVVVYDSAEPEYLAYGYPEDFAKANVAGKVAVIERGDITFEEKVENAANAGAIGCIVVNNQPGSISMAIDTYEIPAVSVEQYAADYLIGATETKMEISEDKEYVENSNAGLMSDFSNWGTTPMLTLDPTVTSVGGMVYSSYNTGDSDYDVLSGTSMAAPNFAGTVATVMQYLKDNTEMSKTERAEYVINLLESGAEILYDAYEYPYSPRKQGTGLANADNALLNLLESGYISNPVQELGDDKERTGHYTFDVELNNESEYDLFYLPSAYLMNDFVYDYNEEDPSADPLYINDLSSDYIYYGNEGYADVTYKISGKDVSEGFTLASGTSCTVSVDIQLDAEIKAYFDEQFVNGNYVEGYVIFDDVETANGSLVYYDEEENAYLFDANGAYQVDENYAPVLNGGAKVYFTGDVGELGINVWSSTHATMLAYYGDWTDGDVLESVDFRDLIEADYFANTEAADDEGYTYADYGYSGADFLEYYTNPNMAYSAVILDGQPYDFVWYLGDNLYDYAPFYEEHISFSTELSNGTGLYANGFYLEPYQLRNCRNLIMTVSDKNTGEVYFVDNTEYLPKSMFDEEAGEWFPLGAFYWDGTNTDGEYVPSGTIVNINFDAVLPYAHEGDTDEWDGTFVGNVWNFDVLVDYEAPEIEAAEFDEADKTVTVTASDEHYLSNIVIGAYVYDDEAKDYVYEEYDAASFSSNKAGESFTATFDVSELLTLGCNEIVVTAMDYATNCNELSFEVSDHCPCNDYLDLDSRQWYHEGVDYVLTNGLMNGVAEDLFAPNGELTRAMLVTILYRLEGEPDVKNLDDMPFDDVPYGQWYSEAVVWAASEGIINGISETEFAPNKNITREQIAAILYRYAGSPKTSGNLLEYTDAFSVSEYAYDAMVWAVDQKIINGMSGKLAPKDNATRAQIATIFYRYLSK